MLIMILYVLARVNAEMDTSISSQVTTHALNNSSFLLLSIKNKIICSINQSINQIEDNMLTKNLSRKLN